MAKKETTNYGDKLDAKKMRVTSDKQWIVVNGQQFKRTVLPSPMQSRAIKAEEEELLDEIEES